MFQYTEVSGWFVPKITKLCLNLSKLCLEYCGLLFFQTRYSCDVAAWFHSWNSLSAGFDLSSAPADQWANSQSLYMNIYYLPGSLGLAHATTAYTGMARCHCRQLRFIVIFSAREHICYSALYAIARYMLSPVCLSVRLSGDSGGYFFGKVRDKASNITWHP